MHLGCRVEREHTNPVLLYVEFFGIRVVRVLVCTKKEVANGTDRAFVEY